MLQIPISVYKSATQPLNSLSLLLDGEPGDWKWNGVINDMRDSKQSGHNVRVDTDGQPIHYRPKRALQIVDVEDVGIKILNWSLYREYREPPLSLMLSKI